MGILERVKLSLRMRSGAFDEELNLLISACKLDIEMAGVVNIDEDDELISLAIIVYCKANFGSDNTSYDGKENYHKRYLHLLERISLNQKYNTKEGASALS